MISKKTNIVICEGVESFKQLKEQWQGFQNNYYFQSYKWNRLLASVNTEGKFIFICFYTGSDLVAILPLQKLQESRLGVRFTYLGFYEPDHMFLHDMAVKDHRSSCSFSYQEIFQALSQAGIQFDYLKLRRVYNDDLKKSLNIDNTLFVRIISNRSRLVDCTLGFEHYFSQLSKNRRKGIKKRYRQLEEHGPVRMLVSDKNSRDDCMERFLQMEKTTWKGDKGNAILNTHGQTNFFRQIAQYEETLILLLEVNGVLVAGRVCVVSNNTLFICKTSYNENYRQYAPGELLLMETVKYACAENIDTINLMSDLPYHQHLSNASRPLCNYELYTKNIRCIVLIMVRKIISTLKSYKSG